MYYFLLKDDGFSLDPDLSDYFCFFSKDESSLVEAGGVIEARNQLDPGVLVEYQGSSAMFYTCYYQSAVESLSLWLVRWCIPTRRAVAGAECKPTWNVISKDVMKRY